MRDRLVLPLAAIAVVLGLVGWGLLAPRDQPRAATVSHLPHWLTTSPTPSPAPTWRLEFNARFSGTALDKAMWGTCFPWANAATGCTNFSGHESQWYLASQDRVSGGALALVAERLPTAGRSARGAPKEYYCRSGLVSTYPSFRFEYGYVKVVARLTAQPGLWPALWLAAANLHWPPEIDLVEHFGVANGLTSVFLHAVGIGQLGHRVPSTGLSRGWHTFAISWTPAELSWFADGKLIMTTTSHIPHQRMYFIANLAYYLKSSSHCQGTLRIRSVQIWQTPAELALRSGQAKASRTG